VTATALDRRYCPRCHWCLVDDRHLRICEPETDPKETND
jgi:hypothetical protein